MAKLAPQLKRQRLLAATSPRPAPATQASKTALAAALPPSTRPGRKECWLRPHGTQRPHVVAELQMTLDDINVIFCAVDVEVGERFVYREQKAEENEIKMKCSHRHLCFATVDAARAERVLAAASPPST